MTKIYVGLQKLKTIRVWEEFQHFTDMHLDKDSLLNKKDKKVIEQTLYEIGVELMNRGEMSWKEVYAVLGGAK